MHVDTSALSAKVNAMWAELSAEERESEGGQTEEQRSLAVARRLARTVAVFCAQVPSKLVHLMPAPLTQQMEQAATYASSLYENLMVCEVY